MGQQPVNQTTYKLAGESEVFDDATNIYLDYKAIDLLGLKTSVPDLVANPELAPNRLVLINHSLAIRLRNRYDLSEADLVGRSLIQEPEYTNEETAEVGFPYEIRGTFADVNVFSLRDRVNPTFLTVLRNPRYVYWAAIRYQNDSPRQILKKERGIYDGLNLGPVFIHEFLEDNLEELYEEESRIATLSTCLSLIAFAPDLLGLVALKAYLTALRQRDTHPYSATPHSPNPS